jgi:hypothetical protein
VRFDFLRRRSVGNSALAIEQRMGIQIWWCGFHQIRIIYPRYDQGIRNPVWSWDRRGAITFCTPYTFDRHSNI